MWGEQVQGQFFMYSYQIIPSQKGLECIINGDILKAVLLAFHQANSVNSLNPNPISLISVMLQYFQSEKLFTIINYLPAPIPLEVFIAPLSRICLSNKILRKDVSTKYYLNPLSMYYIVLSCYWLVVCCWEWIQQGLLRIDVLGRGIFWKSQCLKQFSRIFYHLFCS